GVIAAERASDAVRDSSGLAARPSSLYVDADVELPLRARHAERGQGGQLEHAAAEECQRILLVDGDPSLTGLDADSRHGVLPPPAWLAGIARVLLGRTLRAGHLHPRGVDDDHVVAAVEVRRKRRLVLAAQHPGHA